MFFVKRSCLAFIFPIFLFYQCAAFQKTVKITPAPFDYKSISENYFARGDEKPFPLTVQKGNNLYNSTTIDGKYLFYTTDHDGNYDIWFRDLQSAIIVPVTSHPAPEYKPAISPDGKKLLFVSEENDSSGDIVLVDINPSEYLDHYLSGNKEHIEEKFFLTNPNFSDPQKRDNYTDTDPAWAPDGKRIVFSSDRFSPGLQNLVLLDLSNKNKMTLLTQKGAASPCFAYDGKSIVYLSFQDSKEGSLYRLYLDTGKEERLTTDQNLNSSPSLSPNGNFLYFTSIRNDTNKNGYLDLADNSFIIKLDLTTKKEMILTTDSVAVFDTKFSLFNNGSILYSAALYNTINIYFIPESGPIPKKQTIEEQFNFALRIKKTQDNYFLALDSVKLFFESDPLFAIYEAKVKDNKAEFEWEKGKQKEARLILNEMLTYENDAQNSISYALGLRRLNRISGKKSDEKLYEYYNIIKDKTTDKQILASILKLVGGEKEKGRYFKEAKNIYETILKIYPEYFERREVKRKLAKLEYSTGSIIPERYFELVNDSSISMEDLKYILNDIENKIIQDKNYIQQIDYTNKLLEENKLKERSKILFELVTYLKSKALNDGKKFQESNTLLDSFLEPSRRNPDCDINPFCIKFLVCSKNPTCLKAHLLKSKNFEGIGTVTSSFDELRIFLENYDPELGVELNKSEIEKTFRYYENKARDHEARGNSSPANRSHLRDAAFHYFFNVENMYLLKEKNLFVEDLYKDYAVYYQKKMVDSIFNYAQKQALDNKNNLLDRLNVLGSEKLNIFGRITNFLSTVLDNRITNNLKILGDFKDLKKEIILGKPGEQDDAIKILDAHFSLGRPRSRPVLYLASLYGYAYYLINKSLIYETHYRETGTMTTSRKEGILRDLRNAENELKWIIFADPQYADAHQLLGWLYQYIDIFKSTKPSPNEPSDGEIYATTYAKYFSEKHFEANINLYKQVLDMLGNIPNKKILSDLNLNLANNYLLLQNYPLAKEHYSKVENYGKNIVEQIQFENYKQTALFNYNYARSLISMGEYNKAIKYLSNTAEIYYENEYYKEVGNDPAGLNQSDKKKEKKVFEVNNKLVLIFSLLGLAERETGNFINAINAYKKALALNYNSGYVDNINIYSSLALCYQKVEKYHLSDYYISKVETEYKKFKLKERFTIPSIADKFWNMILPDKVRVIGEGRFPGEFAPEEHYLLAMGIRIQNLTEQGEFEEVEKQIAMREKFLKDTGINKLIIGEEIILNAKYKIGYDNFIQGKYEKALSHYDSFLESIISNKTKSINPIAERRNILKRKSFTLFRLVESGEANYEKLLPVLKDNLHDLNAEKSFYLEVCLAKSKLSRKESGVKKECEEKFNKEWYPFEPLLGLSYFYLGEVLNASGEYDSAFYYYGLAIPLLKDPAGVAVENIGLPGDLYLKTERLRLKINLAIVYFRIGDEKQFNATIKETEELALEFQTIEDYVKIKLLKAKFLYSKAKTKNDYLYIIQELDLAERKIFQSYATLIDLEDNFFHELYGLYQETYFRLGNWKEIHSKEEKLYNVLLFVHFQNTRIIFEEEKLEGLSQSIRESIRKDLENNFKYKNLVNTRKPLSNFIHTRLEINSEIERLLSIIRKYFPEKKRFFELNTKELSQNDIPDQHLYRFKIIKNTIVINHIEKGKDNFSTIPISSDIKSSLETYFSKELNRNRIESLICIPDKSLANFDFGSIQINGKNLSSLVKINYALTMRQVSPVVHKNFQWEDIAKTSVKKEDNTQSSIGRFIETSNLKKLGPILNDSDILNTGIYYANGNVFSPSVKGSINLKEFAERYSSLTMVILNHSKLEEGEYFKTLAAIEVVQSSGVPFILLGGKNSINPMEIRPPQSFNWQDARTIGLYTDRLQAKSKREYETVKEEAFQMEREKKYREALTLFLEADTLVSSLNQEDLLESELNLARIKSKSIPKMKRFIFYERLLKKYEYSKPDKVIIYESLLHQCYINFSNKYCRDHFKNFYKSLKSSSELSADTKRRSKVLVNFYIQINNGSIINIEKNYQNFLKSVYFQDLFLFHEDMCRFFTKNFILDKADFHAKQVLKLAATSGQREVALNLANEIELQSYFTMKSNVIDLSEVTNSIYKDGIENNWKSVGQKIQSLDRKTYDDILIKYRQRLLTVWKNIHSGSEYNPLELISENTSTGKSVYTFMSQTDRVLLFNLLLNSIQYQADSEVNTVFNAFLDLQKENFKKIQNIYMRVAWIEELFNRGDYLGANNYIVQLEPELEKFTYDYDLKRRFQFAKFKTTMLANESIIKFKPVNQRILNTETNWYPYYSKAKSVGIENFNKFVNEILEEKSNKIYDNYNRREFLDLITYLELLCFRSNASEVFLDLAFYRDKIEDVNRLRNNAALFADLPKIDSIAFDLLKKIPNGQEFIAVVNFGLQTFTIKIENGKSNGELAFNDYRLIKNEIYNYHKQVKEKGNGILLKDYLEPKFRNKILLKKNKLSYLYLSSFYLKTPLELKEEDNFYIVQNPSLLITRKIKKSSDFFKGNFSLKRYSSISEEDKELFKLESLEVKERKGNSSLSIISGEKLKLSENTELQFGKFPLNKLKTEPRNGVWFLSNSDLYNTSFYKDDLNISLNYLDQIHNGPGIFSLGEQSTTANILFMKILFQQTELQTSLKTRFLEALKGVKNTYPQEINWNGYRMYTNTLIEE